MSKPVVAVVMGSDSDWPVMQHAVEQLEKFEVPYLAKVVSAHRTPDLLAEFAKSARDEGLACIIAGAGGAAHLPGMLAANTTLPVLGVPVATFAIGKAGAINAALFAVAMLGNDNADYQRKLDQFREDQQQAVFDMVLPPVK